MKRKLLAALLTLVLVTGIAGFTAMAATAAPTVISAPLNFAASNYGGHSVYCTLSASDDLRALIDQTEQERGYHMKILGQVDFKVDNGGWHYSVDWDNPATYAKYALNYYNPLNGGEHGQYLGHQGLMFRTTFPNDKNVPVPAAFTSWDWYKNHSMTLRARFAVVFGKNVVFSGWSEEYVLSDASKMDYKKIMNDNAPAIISSKIEVRGVTKVPWVVLQLGRHPVQTQKFNAASSNAMWTEVWLRKQGDTDFKNVGAVPFSNEVVMLNVDAYFKDKAQNYDAQAYEVKVRYKVDERDYQQSGATALNWLYSPYSNTFGYKMPAWSGASQWATSELQKASDMGLIPGILKGQDLTRNITREEFAEVALLMYEKASGITNTTPVSPNPFADTSNPQILKAFKLGIAKGVSATEFKPKDLINREQVAAMLARTIRIIAPNADYSAEGAPTFTDRKEISGWALQDCLYMAKIGIIKGSDGKFMPRATTDAQKAVGYANTSREQALAMSVRAVEKIPGIKDSKATESGSQTQNTQPASSQPATSQPASSEPDELLVGFWGSNMTSLSNFDSAGNYTGAGLSGEWWKFEADGTYTYIIIFNKGGAIAKGKYRQGDGKIYLSDSAEKDFFDTKAAYKSVPDKTWRYYFQTKDGADILRMTEFESTEYEYFDYYYKKEQ